MDPANLPAVKSSPRPSLQSMQPVAVTRASTLPRALATTRHATKEDINLLSGEVRALLPPRRARTSPTLSEKTDVETAMPVSLAWLEKWEILEGHSEGHHRFRAPWSPASTLTSRLDRALSDADTAPMCRQASSHDDLENVVGGWILV